MTLRPPRWSTSHTTSAIAPYRALPLGEHGAANLRLFRLVAKVLHAIEAGVFRPNPASSTRTAPFRAGAERGGGRAAPGKEMNAMMQVIPTSGSRNVNG